MYYDLPGTKSMDTLLNEIFSLIEDRSCVFIDDYKWYELHIVLDVLGCDFDIIEDINLLYLMEMNNTAYISEEGVNFILVNFDNHYKDNVSKFLSENIMPDIREYSMYMVDNVRNEVRDMTLLLDPDKMIQDKKPADAETIIKSNGRLLEYSCDNKKPMRRRRCSSSNRIW